MGPWARGESADAESAFRSPSSTGGVAVGVGAGVGVAAGADVGVGASVAVGTGSTVPATVGVGAGVGVAAGADVGVGASVAVGTGMGVEPAHASDTASRKKTAQDSSFNMEAHHHL